MPEQYNYSYMAGGDTTATSPNDIKEAFNQVAHNLDDIQTFIRNKWNFSNTLGDNNPCSGCHNPHRAKRDPHTSGSPRIVGGNLVVSAVSRPSDHNQNNNAWRLWGDDPGERMSDYTPNYQAPCRYPWSSTCSSFEPDGSNTMNGSNLFDTVTFCLDCHGSAPQFYSNRLNRNVKIIDWGAGGDVHGLYNDGNWDSYFIQKSPYNQNDLYNYVLSCLDCHEPHGSRNEYLLRQEVNGNQVPVIAQTGRWYYFCISCHTSVDEPEIHVGPSGDCSSCHGHPFKNGF